MTMAQVHNVLEVARCQNLSRAAERLFVSQSALSQQIRRLEDELGYRLFARTMHGVQLTPEGEQFCAKAQPVEQSWQNFAQQVRRQAEGEKKKLRIAMGSRVYSNGLFQDVVRFFDHHPEIDVTFLTEAGMDFLTELRESNLDLALDRLPAVQSAALQGEFYVSSLIAEEQCVLMAPTDPRRTRPELTVSELEGSAMISGLEHSAEDQDMQEICRAHRVNFCRIYRSDSIDTGMNLVRSGKALGFGPRSFADYYHVAAVPLAPQTQVALQFICLKSRLEQRQIALFRTYLLEICRQRGFSA